MHLHRLPGDIGTEYLLRFLAGADIFEAELDDVRLVTLAGHLVFVAQLRHIADLGTVAGEGPLFLNTARQHTALDRRPAHAGAGPFEVEHAP